MKNVGTYIASLVLLISPVTPAKGQNIKAEKKEKVTGTVIAQSGYGSMLCGYHPCALWLIVRVEDNKARQPRYACVTVEYFPDKFPSELIDKAKEWLFEAVRDTNRDGAIEKYLRVLDSETGKDISEKVAAPAWKLLAGAENEIIPFGKVLPSYFVRSGKYEAHRK